MSAKIDVWRLGPFSLEENLRHDRQGSVFRAIHLEQRRQYAIKVIQAPLLERGPARDDFLNEVTQLKRLRHRNLVRCFGGGVDSGYFYLVNELVDGEDLAAVLRRRGRFSWEDATAYGLGLCDALEYAVKEGFVHHDFTPEKILIDREGVIRVTDFRVTRLKNPTCTPSLSHTLPRVAYMAPEWFDRPEEASHKADIYSLGCVLFEMLSGRPPFVGRDAAETIQLQRQQMAPRVSSLALETPVWLDHLIGQTIAKNPAERPYGITAVRSGLHEAAKNAALGATVVQHVAKASGPLRVQASRREAQRVLDRGQGVRKVAEVLAKPWLWIGVVVALFTFVAMVAGLALLLRPLDEATLMARAEALVATGKESDAKEARKRYLQPLLKRFPEGEHAPKAREMLAKMDVDDAKDRVAIARRFNRTMRTEVGRRFQEAAEHRQFGNLKSAKRGFQDVLKLEGKAGPDGNMPDDEDKALFALARQELATIDSDMADQEKERQRAIEERMVEADRLMESSDDEGARKIWKEVIELYRDEESLTAFVEQAAERLKETESETESGPNGN